jgi:hypothetical protein
MQSAGICGTDGVRQKSKIRTHGTSVENGGNVYEGEFKDLGMRLAQSPAISDLVIRTKVIATALPPDWCLPKKAFSSSPGLMVCSRETVVLNLSRWSQTSAQLRSIWTAKYYLELFEGTSLSYASILKMGSRERLFDEVNPLPLESLEVAQEDFRSTLMQMLTKIKLKNSVGGNKNPPLFSEIDFEAFEDLVNDPYLVQMQPPGDSPIYALGTLHPRTAKNFDGDILFHPERPLILCDYREWQRLPVRLKELLAVHEAWPYVSRSLNNWRDTGFENSLRLLKYTAEPGQ